MENLNDKFRNFQVTCEYDLINEDGSVTHVKSPPIELEEPQFSMRRQTVRLPDGRLVLGDSLFELRGIQRNECMAFIRRVPEGLVRLEANTYEELKRLIAFKDEGLELLGPVGLSYADGKDRYEAFLAPPEPPKPPKG